MSQDRRFNRQEISEILRLAAEFDHRDRVERDTDGLTLEELKEVAEEVGIDPGQVERAVRRLDEPVIHERGPRWLGGPFTHYQTEHAGGQVSRERWEEVVSAIRKINGGIGKIQKMGRRYEWEQRKSNVGYLHLSLSPEERETTITLSSDYTNFALLAYVSAGFYGAILFLIGGSELISDGVADWIYGLSGLAAGLIGARFYIGRWFRNKRNLYRKLTDRIRKVIEKKAPTVGTETAPKRDGTAGVAIPDSGGDVSERERDSSRPRQAKSRN